MSSSNCCFLNCIHISQEESPNFPQFNVIHTVKGFGIVNKAEIDVFLELSCFFDDPEDVGSFISDSSALSETGLNIWKFMVHVLLMPGLENFENYFTSVWDECNCWVVWASFGIAFLWDWNENWPFSVLCHVVNHNKGGWRNQRHSLTKSGDGTVGAQPKERVSILDLGEQEFFGGAGKRDAAGSHGTWRGRTN